MVPIHYCSYTDHSRRSMTLAHRAHEAQDMLKYDPEKSAVRGGRIYTGHPHPVTEIGNP